MQRELDPMVCHPSLWVIIRSYFLRTVACADLAAPFFRLFIMRLSTFQLVQPCAEYLQCLIFILQLRLLILARYYDARRDMGQPHGRIRRIDTLSAIPRSAEHIKLAVVHIQLDLDVLHLWHDRHCRRRCMDAPAGFCRRDPLHPVYAALIFQLGICAGTIYHENDFLKPADPVFIGVHHIYFPAVLLCIFAVHAIQISGK